MKLLLLLPLFLMASSLFAQSDTLDQFYYQNSSMQIDQIEREHLPLDGATACMIPFRQDSLFGFIEKEALIIR